MSKQLRNISLEIIILMTSLIIIVPLAIMVFGSFKDPRGAAQLNLSLPTIWHFDNYITVFTQGKLGRALMNSIYTSVPSVLLVVVMSAMSAFYLVRRNTKLNTWILNLFYFGLVAPLALIPTIQVLQWIGISGTYTGAILIFSALHLSFSIFLFGGFIKTVPRELDEAGAIDGCGSWRLFFSIVFPLLLPVVATNAIIVFMGVWNDLTIPLFFLNSSEKWTMPLMVYNFFGQYSKKWNLVFADLIITAAPVLIFYIAGQRFIIEGMTGGAIKG